VSTITLTRARLGQFTELYNPKPFDKDGTEEDKRYSAVFHVIAGSPDHKMIDKAINDVAKEVFGAQAEAQLKRFRADSKKYCFRDGDTNINADGEPYDACAGTWMLTAHRYPFRKFGAGIKGHIVVVNKNLNPVKSGEPQAPGIGDFVNSEVQFYAQKGEFAGIRCELFAVQFAAKGEPIEGGGHRPSASAFRVIEDEEEALA
jgi:hypothetical protein